MKLNFAFKFALVSLGSLLLAAGLVFGQPNTAPFQSSLAGNYTVVGANPDGQSYMGVLEVERLDARAETYRMRWTLGRLPDGTWMEVLGYGFVEKGQLVSIMQDQVTGAVVVALYAADAGNLKGVWSPAGSGVVAPETATRSTQPVEMLKLMLPSAEERAL